MRISLLAAVVLFAGVAGIGSLAKAADSCEMQVKALEPQIAALTDDAKKAKATKLEKKAIDEATEEADEDECLDYLKDLKELLGVQ